MNERPPFSLSPAQGRQTASSPTERGRSKGRTQRGTGGEPHASARFIAASRGGPVRLHTYLGQLLVQSRALGRLLERSVPRAAPVDAAGEGDGVGGRHCFARPACVCERGICAQVDDMFWASKMHFHLTKPQV